jgi:foldase protein PrsA
MGERTHTAGGSGTARRKWTLVIAGTAIVLLTAGVAIQVTRPASAFPEDGAAGKPAAPGSARTGNQPQKINSVAKVGNQFISYDELASECVARHGKEILDNLVNRKIIQQACDAQGIEVSEAEVNAEINKIAKKFGLDPENWLKMLQAERNVTAAQYKRDIIWPMLALKKLAGENVTITDVQLKNAFVRNYGPRVKAKAIVLDNQRRANEVWAKVNARPEDFERMAREHSVDSASRPLDGVIPPIPRHGGAPELENAAFKLQEGEISGVIQVGLNQFIILKCEGRTEPTVTDIKEVEDVLKQELQEEKVQQAVAKTFQKLKDEARVDNYLTGTSTAGDRRPSAARQNKNTGNVRQTGAAGGAKRSAKPISDADADADPDADTDADALSADEVPSTPPAITNPRGAVPRNVAPKGAPKGTRTK